MRNVHYGFSCQVCLLLSLEKTDPTTNNFAEDAIKKNLYDACHYREGNRKHATYHEPGNPCGHAGNKQEDMKTCSPYVFWYDRTFHRIYIEMKSEQHKYQPNGCCYPEEFIFEEVS